jgi:cytochrome c-type biogenesis protein CcmE
VAEKAELGDRRFRVEGAVVTGSVREGDGQVRFEIINAGEVVPVVYEGDEPPELFKEGIPVVLEGRWQGDVYASDGIMVKHTSEYREKNPDRTDEYVGKNDDGTAP